MFRRIPVVSTPITFKDLCSGCVLTKSEDKIIKSFSSYLGPTDLFFTNSATSSLFIILEALRELTGKKEVIIPAYTASGLVFAIRKAHLTPTIKRNFWGNFPHLLIPILNEPPIRSKKSRCYSGWDGLGKWRRAKIPLPCSQAFARACKEELS